MTFQELLQLPAEDLDKMSRAQIEAYFAPYLDITRPKTKTPVSRDMKDAAKFEQDLARKLKAKGFSLKDFGL